MDQSTLDYVESFVVTATLEIIAALDRGAVGDDLDSALVFVRNEVFVETATLTRSVEAAENAVKNFDAKVLSIKFCEACERHKIGGRCVTCVANEDMAALIAANQDVSR